MTAFIEAVAHLLGAIAWPGVTAVGAWYFYPQIVALVNRIEEWGSVKFGRAPSQAGAPAAPPLAPSVPSIQVPQTPATLALEDTIKKAPFLQGLAGPAEREQALITFLARALASDREFPAGRAFHMG